MIKKLFKKNSIELCSPMAGLIIKIEDVEDQVFSQKMVGDGFAIKPTTGNVYSPVDGKIVQLFPTKHAIGIIDNSGLEILIHVGIDTVELKGEGFIAHVKKDDTVTKGQLLLEVDLEYIVEAGKSTTTPIVFTNKSQYKSIEVVQGHKKIDDIVCKIRK